MSTEEFEQWRVMFRVEELHPQSEQLRHAQLLAAIATGAIGRRGKKAWLPSDFMKAEPWAVKPAKRAPPTFQQLSAQVAGMNAARRRGR